VKPDDHSYSGMRGPGGCTVLSGWTPLKVRLELRNHSPTGFEWGYGGSGPSQLALALLADFTGDDALALSKYQEFKRTFIATIDGDTWRMDGATIRRWLQNQQPEEA